MLEWTEDFFNEMYAIPVSDPAHPRFGERVGYTRLGMEMFSRAEVPGPSHHEERADRLISSLDISEGSTVLVVGCGFGFLCEALIDRGMKAVGVDSSPYIESRWGDEARSDVPVVFGDVRNRRLHRDIMRAGGMRTSDRYDWVITESMIESASDEELPKVLSSCSILGHNVAHALNENLPSPFNSKTLDEWSNVNKRHSWMDVDSWEVRHAV